MAKRPSQKIRKTLADLTKGRVQDRYDIEQLLTLHGDHIDLERVRTFVHEFAQILDAAERIPEFDRLLRKVLGPAQ
jgi:hypothetical protein